MWLALCSIGQYFLKYFSLWQIYVGYWGEGDESWRESCEVPPHMYNSLILVSSSSQNFSLNYSQPRKMTYSRKDYLWLSVSPCPVILQRKYIYKALTPGSSLIFLKIWVRDWFCDWAQNESCSFMPSSKQVVLWTGLFIQWVQSPNRKRKREKRGENSLPKRFLISPGTYREEKDI